MRSYHYSSSIYFVENAASCDSLTFARRPVAWLLTTDHRDLLLQLSLLDIITASSSISSPYLIEQLRRRNSFFTFQSIWYITVVRNVEFLHLRNLRWKLSSVDFNSYSNFRISESKVSWKSTSVYQLRKTSFNSIDFLWCITNSE